MTLLMPNVRAQPAKGRDASARPSTIAPTSLHEHDAAIFDSRSQSSPGRQDSEESVWLTVIRRRGRCCRR